MSPFTRSAASRPFRACAALAVAGALVGSLAACAPEPGSEAGRTEKDRETVNPETEWSGQQEHAYEPTAELPDTFPEDLFDLPEGTTIHDAGARSETSWFVVVLAENETTAGSLWQAVIDGNALQVQEEGETSDGGRFASLANAALRVEALTVPQSDGSVQLSYDLQRLG